MLVQTKVDDIAMQAVAHSMHRWAGVTLDLSKTYLVEQRLGPLKREYGCDSYLDLLALAEKATDRTVRSRIVDLLTTHETKFFRDVSFCETMSQSILPGLVERARHGDHIRIWSAGCSTGQEACTLAIMLASIASTQEMQRINIIGTDVSKNTVDQANLGVYSECEVRRGLDESHVTNHFRRVPDGFQLKPTLKAMLRFRVENLSDAAIANERFDLILCRNVLIYFSDVDSDRIIRKIVSKMNDQTYLFVGCSEILDSPQLSRVAVGQTTAYRPRA